MVRSNAIERRRSLKKAKSSRDQGGRVSGWIGPVTTRSPAGHRSQVTVEGLGPDGIVGQQGSVADVEPVATGDRSEAEPLGPLVVHLNQAIYLHYPAPPWWLFVCRKVERPVGSRSRRCP